MTIIDTRKNELKKIIQVLWEHANYGSFYENLADRPEFDWYKGIKDVRPSGYIEYFCGKELNILVTSNNIKKKEYLF